MSDLFQVKEYEVMVDQSAHPEMNYPRFIDHVNQELKKFADHVSSLQSEFIAPQDVGGVGGLICRFHSLNGYPAIRQINQFNPATKKWLVYFDCRVLELAPQAAKANGSLAAKLEPVETPDLIDPLPAPALVN